MPMFLKDAFLSMERKERNDMNSGKHGEVLR